MLELLFLTFDPSIELRASLLTFELISAVNSQLTTYHLKPYICPHWYATSIL